MKSAKMTIYKVTVNNISWHSPRNYYFKTRQEAERIAKKYPAHDSIRAVTMTEANAKKRLEMTTYELYV